MTEITLVCFAYFAHHKHGLGILDDQLIAGVGGGAIKRLAAWAPFLAEGSRMRKTTVGLGRGRWRQGIQRRGAANNQPNNQQPTTNNQQPTQREISSGNRS